MTDQPAPPRRSDEEEFMRNVYGHLDAIRVELRAQDERLEHLAVIVHNIAQGLEDRRSHLDGWRDTISLVGIGVVIGVMIGWAWR